MKHVLMAAALIMALAFLGSAQAHDKHQQKTPAKTPAGKVEFLGKGDGVTTCPVSGEPIENKDNKAMMFGRTVYFCCPDCLAAAKKNPAAYIKPTHKAQLAAIKNLPKSEGHHEGHHAEAAKPESHEGHQMEAAAAAPQGDAKFLGKGDGIETCPVTGEAVNKNLKSEVNGQTFYVCCEGCIEVVKKNPDAYLKKPAKK